MKDTRAQESQKPSKVDNKSEENEQKGKYNENSYSEIIDIVDSLP